ncbi:hypothetical protein RF11_01775 [Thelohanellus kitauei]|uniref:Uncharacterized protein n=1 Tax=Thelohanellus kitauei TaxID=669202 RepID=A0A0C2IQJ8_THEKT|nr:hypothetical protein RF11_01775 [Thelohanellus kitauei]
MNIIVSLLVLLFIDYSSQSNFENYAEIYESWQYNTNPHYQPTYKTIGVVRNGWTVVPTVPFDDPSDQTSTQSPSNYTIEDYQLKHYDPTFMSITAPSYEAFEFKSPAWLQYQPTKKCLYPKLKPLYEEYGKEIGEKSRIMLKKLFVCPIDYYWMDYGPNQFPRYILQGFCRPRITVTSKDCRPCETMAYVVLRNFCQNDVCKWVYMKQNLLIWCTQFY